MKPRVHAEMIKAWADGYEIEVFIPEQDKWVDVAKPEWFDNMEYRVKPGVIARRPRITQRWANIEINPFTDELEITEAHTDRDSVGALNVVMTFENDDITNIAMVEDTEDDVPW